MKKANLNQSKMMREQQYYAVPLMFKATPECCSSFLSEEKSIHNRK